mmetsp:Transcript_35132/g.76778  ORF Transcript_35132/g.76778 Transcript_35132/m.76778 type:complete len:250 (+) Transcript_35132:1690-2439(+)
MYAIQLESNTPSAQRLPRNVEAAGAHRAGRLLGRLRAGSHRTLFSTFPNLSAFPSKSATNLSASSWHPNVTYANPLHLVGPYVFLLPFSHTGRSCITPETSLKFLSRSPRIFSFFGSPVMNTCGPSSTCSGSACILASARSCASAASAAFAAATLFFSLTSAACLLCGSKAFSCRLARFSNLFFSEGAAGNVISPSFGPADTFTARKRSPEGERCNRVPCIAAKPAPVRACMHCADIVCNMIFSIVWKR